MNRCCSSDEYEEELPAERAEDLGDAIPCKLSQLNKVDMRIA